MPEKTHWKNLTNPNYLGGYSIPEGQDIIVTIDYVRREEITGTNGKKEFEVVAHLKNGVLPFILNKTNMKTIQKLYGSPYIEDWSGRAVQIYFDPTVKFGRETLGGLRIRPFVPKQEKIPLVCEDCGGAIVGTETFAAEKIAAHAYEKYGKALCISCAKAEKARLEAGEAPNVLGGTTDEND
jgi:hypothetical protein